LHIPRKTRQKGEEQVKVYIAGKITGNPDYKQQFAEAEKKLREKGHTTMNPAVLPDGFEHQEYMKICFSMIDVCDAVFFLDNWRDSIGANMEIEYAFAQNKGIMFEEV
jgi:hypothetical protein